MHEMAIALALIEQAEKVAREQNARAIPGITVVVGRLSGTDPDALRAVFELAAEETLAAGATLTVDMAAGRELYIKSMDVDVEEGEEVRGEALNV
ncbi:MAG: hydrogenase maturation nickel metallochaperone HypA [bacterium]